MKRQTFRVELDVPDDVTEWTEESLHQALESLSFEVHKVAKLVTQVVR